MTDKPIGEWRVGDPIADMHYGIGPLVKRYKIVSHVRWDEPLAVIDSGPGFGDYLGKFKPRTGYLNKFLVVLGFTDDSTLAKPEVVCGYCYDGVRSGIVVLSELEPEK